MKNKKKYFETLITISVISEDEPYTFTSYENLAQDVIYEHYSGHVVEEVHEELNENMLVEKCAEHGTEVSFFIVDEVEDAEDE